MLLSEGVPCPAVIAGLDDMIRKLQQIPGSSARDSWALVRHSYLQLIEDLEQALWSWFEDDDGAVAGLHGGRYKLIREMSATPQRPYSLINDEAARQVAVLQRLRARVEALAQSRVREGRIAVLDANALMHYQRLDEIEWAKLLGVSPVRIILPICVIDELDYKKYAGSDRISRRAAMAIAALRKYSAGPPADGVTILPDGTTLEMFLDDPDHLRMTKPDDELCARCLLLQRAIGSPVTVVTGDLGMRLRASRHGLVCAEMPGKYAKDAKRRAACGDD